MKKRTAEKRTAEKRTAEKRKAGNAHTRAPFVSAFPQMIRVVLPFHLRNLARVDGELELAVAAPVTISAVLDVLEEKFPTLRGTIRDHGTLKRRAFVRFFICKEDWSLESPDKLLPAEILNGSEPFLVVGAMAGG